MCGIGRLSFGGAHGASMRRTTSFVVAFSGEGFGNYKSVDANLAIGFLLDVTRSCLRRTGKMIDIWVSSCKVLCSLFKIP